MGTNSAPLLADLIVSQGTFDYDLMPRAENESSMSKQTKAIQFSNTFRHIDGLYYSALATRTLLEITSGPFTRRNLKFNGQFHIIN